MATMMMAGLAALAGKALMTSMLALMMSAFSAMRGGGGGGGGGGETKTYEVITKPIVSHINTHTSEVQHDHHGHYHKRSLGGQQYPVEDSQEDSSRSNNVEDVMKQYEGEKRHLPQILPALSEISFESMPPEHHYQKRSLRREEYNDPMISIMNNPRLPQHSQTMGRGKRSVKFQNLSDSKIYKYPNIPESLKNIYSVLSAQAQNYKAHRRVYDGQLPLPLKFTI